jgi:hypothetical protein
MWRCAPVVLGPRQLGFFKARSKTLMSFWSGSLQMAKYECTVRHVRNSLGSMRHWQPLLSRDSTVLNTSYSSTHL